MMISCQIRTSIYWQTSSGLTNRIVFWTRFHDYSAYFSLNQTNIWSLCMDWDRIYLAFHCVCGFNFSSFSLVHFSIVYSLNADVCIDCFRCICLKWISTKRSNVDMMVNNRLQRLWQPSICISWTNNKCDYRHSEIQFRFPHNESYLNVCQWILQHSVSCLDLSIGWHSFMFSIMII